VFDFMSSVVGTLSLTLAAERMGPEQVQALAAPLTKCASALSARLGLVTSSREARDGGAGDDGR
jgi:DNA-binding IclR family transcriptional regulator